MSEQKQPRAGAMRTAWVLGILAALGISSYVVMDLLAVTPPQGRDSAIAKRYVDDVAAAAQTQPDHQPEPQLPATFGGPGAAHALVLYDAGTAHAEAAAMMMATLASHFGKVTVKGADRFTATDVAAHTAIIYVATACTADVPPALLQAAREPSRPFMWAGCKAEQLAPGDRGAAFKAAHGWDPSSLRTRSLGTSIRYKDTTLPLPTNPGITYQVPADVDVARVTPLGRFVCGDDGNVPCGDDSGLWAFRAGTFTHVSETGEAYTQEQSRTLALADLFYELLAPDTKPVKQAAVRLEDVGTDADPDKLRAIADHLHGEGVPFQVAVVPYRVARIDDGGWQGLALSDRPEVVRALKYMQERGGTLIQHGTTHQWGDLDNPYSGATGADFEFIRAVCSRVQGPPAEPEPCRNESHIVLTGPVAVDDMASHRRRIEQGRDAMAEAGLGTPSIFETPHYAPSPHAYRAMAVTHRFRYERADHHSGLLDGMGADMSSVASQIYPFRVHDAYGSTVLPENLGNISLTEQNHHPARPPQFIIDGARANLVVRESTASFFFHPFLELDLLKETVAGIQGLGYTFVRADQLR